MHSTRRHFLQGTAAAAASISLPSFAASWPTQPLKIVIPFAPGGTSDVIARLLSKPLGDALGQPVIVENRTGAAGNLGAGVVATSTDGHTVSIVAPHVRAIARCTWPDTIWRTCGCLRTNASKRARPARSMPITSIHQMPVANGG